MFLAIIEEKTFWSRACTRSRLFQTLVVKVSSANSVTHCYSCSFMLEFNGGCHVFFKTIFISFCADERPI